MREVKDLRSLNGHKPPPPEEVTLPHTAVLELRIPFPRGGELDLQVRAILKQQIAERVQEAIGAMIADGRTYVVRLGKPESALIGLDGERVMKMQAWVVLAEILDALPGEHVYPGAMPAGLRETQAGPQIYKVDVPQPDGVVTRYFLRDGVGFRRIADEAVAQLIVQWDEENNEGERDGGAPDGETEVGGEG